MRKIVDLANKIGLERESDVLLREKGRITLELRGVASVFDRDKITKAVLKASVKEKTAFLRGIFMGCGIVSTPPSYHLEFRFEDAKELSFCANLLAQRHIRCHTTYGRIFVKGRENLKKLLFDIGANESYLLLEEDAVMKDVSNKANRKANFEFANIERQTNSSIKQLTIINELIKTGKIDELRDDLREVALLRSQYPLLPLSGLAKKANGRYSKQSIYYRLRKIENAYSK
ncbi:MAG: DNA-binding protein WhiA [Caldisericaceae bacterium]